MFLSGYLAVSTRSLAQSTANASEIVEEQEGATEPGSLQERDEEFQQNVSRLREAVKQARLAEFKYKTSATSDEAEDWHEKFEQAYAEGKAIKQELMENGIPLILDAPQLDHELAAIAKIMAIVSVVDYQYEQSFQVSRRLNELDPSLESQWMLMRTALLTNRFELAAQLREKVVSRIPDLPKQELAMLKTLPELLRIGAEEDRYRLADEKSNLPRVKLETTKGPVVIELYEDQYPDTVGHFIHLVESGFYTNMVFHRVTKNYLPFSVAQTGQFKLQEVEGSKDKAVFAFNLNYQIYDEAPVDGKNRKHLRGAVSLLLKQANGKPVPNSGGSHFLITLVPTPALDGRQIAFGRVLSGMEYIDQIEPTFEISESDGKEKPIENSNFCTILKAEVVRKRDHEYKPNQVTEQK